MVAKGRQHSGAWIGTTVMARVCVQFCRVSVVRTSSWSMVCGQMCEDNATKGSLILILGHHQQIIKISAYPY